MRASKNALILLAIFLTAAPLVSADDIKKHEVKMKDGGTLVFEIPKSWGNRPEISKGDQVIEIRFVPYGTPREPVFAITLHAAVPEEPPTSAVVKQVAETIRDNFKETALEAEIPVQEISGSANTIYYFALTDKEIKPREYQYLTTGVVSDGKMITTCYFFSNDSAPDYAADAMHLMETLRYLPKDWK